MRADRLLTLLLLLQTRGKLSARELADALEVSERTIYRDIDALSAAGIPVYGESGRAGGFDLLDSYKTSLTGLTEGELRVLFMLNLPGPFNDLGIGAEYRQAMLKLTATLPGARRQVEEQVRQRFHLDSSWWDADIAPVPHLQTLYQAVLKDQCLILRRRLWLNVEVDQIVDALGLVAKAGVWYLVCASHSQVRALRVSELLEARLSAQTFTRSAGFDLAAWWRNWCSTRAHQRRAYAITVRVAPAFLPYLASITGASLGEEFSQSDETDPKGWTVMKLYFESLEEARNRLLGCGGGVEVLAPHPLRCSILDFSQQTLALYSSSERKAH